MMGKRIGWVMCCAAAFAAGAVHAQQAADSRPIRLLVPSAPGGPSDFVARLVAPGMSRGLGRNVVVDARASVSGILATEIAAKAAADGATLSIGNSGTHVMNIGLYRKLPYDPIADFEPISQLVSAGTLFMANPKLPVRTFKDFVALAKQSPGKYNIAVAGANGAVTTDVVKYLTGMNLNNIPYKGSAPSEMALISGEVEVALLSVPAMLQHARSGRLRALAITSANRSPLLPDVPTLAEQGLTGFASGNWHGLFAPKGTPRAIIGAVHREAVRVLRDPANRKLLDERGNETIGNSPDEFRAFLTAEVKRMSGVMKAAGVKPRG